MASQPVTLDSDNPGARVFEALADCLLQYPADAEMINIKATVDANPNGLPYHSLIGLFCLASARAAILGAASAGDDFAVVQDLTVGGDSAVAGDSTVTGDQTVNGTQTVSALVVQGASTLTGTVTAPGIAPGTYVGGRPVVFKNPGNNQLYSAVPTPETPANIKTRYIAARADGIPGQGTENDPFDGSTAAKIAALWPLLPTNVNIVFARGTYDLNAYYDAGGGRKLCLPLSTGQNIICDGSVTLRMATNQLTLASTRVDIIASLADGGGHVVRGVIIDGNRANQSAYTGALADVQLYGINLLGFDCTVQNCIVRNTWNSGSDELFLVAIATSAGTWAQPARGLIEGVTIEGHEGFSTLLNLLGTSDYTAPKTATGASSGNVFTCAAHGYAEGDSLYIASKTGGSSLVLLERYECHVLTSSTFQLYVAGTTTVRTLGTDVSTCSIIRQTWITGAVRNCRVIGRGSGDYPQEQGVGAGGWKDVTIERNVLLNVFGGVFTDTHCYEGVQVRGNFIRLRADPLGQAANGIFAGGGFRWKDWQITDNQIVMSPNSFGVRLGSSVGNMQNCLIARNVFLKDNSSAGGFFYPYATDLSGNTGIRIEDDRYSVGMTPETGQPTTLGARLTYARGNRFIDGTVTSLVEFRDSYYGRPAVVARADGGGNADQSIANASRATFDFTDIRTDAGSILNATTNRATAPSAGTMKIVFQVTFVSVGGAGLVQPEILKNGATNVLPILSLTPAVAANSYTITVFDKCAAADYYEASVFNNSGGATVIDRNFQRSILNVEFIPDPV